MSDFKAKMHQIRFRLGLRIGIVNWSLLKNTVVIVVTVYMSIAVRNNMHFVFYQYCCEGRYSINIHLICLEVGKLREFDNDWSGHPAPNFLSAVQLVGHSMHLL